MLWYDLGVPRSTILTVLFMCALGSGLCVPCAASADADVVRALVNAIADPVALDLVRGDAMQRLKQLGLPAVPELIQLTQDTNPNVRAVAVAALGQLDLKKLDDDATLNVLIMLADRDPDPVVRMSALATLGATGSHKALDVLVAALDNDDVRFRRRAVIGLIRLHRPEVVPPLMSHFAKEKDHQVRVNIIRTLGSLGARSELEQLRQSVTETDLRAEIDQQLEVAVFFPKGAQ